MNSPAITLDTPLQRSGDVVTTVTLRKPTAGELRGVHLTDLLQMDVSALQVVLPRITTPALTKVDVAALDPADLLQMATEVAGFLLPRAARQEPSPSA